MIMKKMGLALFFVCLLSVAGVNAQTASPSPTTRTSQAKPKRVIFKANKEQVMEAQKMLNVSETGKLTKDDRAAVKKWQKENGLRATGTLNRATLEKMNIGLTDKQKLIPVAANSFASEAKTSSGEGKKRGAIFRATKEQVMQAQKILSVAETGKMSKADREALKKWQTENGIKATGGLNKMTLEKMNITLTDKQKAM